MKKVPAVAFIVAALLGANRVHAQSLRNVSVEVRAIDIQKTTLKELEVDWNVQLGKLPTFPQWGKPRVSVDIRSLEAKKSVRTHQTSFLRTLDGSRAMLFVGKAMPFTVLTFNGFGGYTQSVQFIDFGVRLAAQPEIQDDGRIKVTFRFDTMTIDPPLANPPAGTIYPLFKERHNEATLVVKDGEPIIVSQFYSDEERKNLSTVPGISRVPILGQLFTSRSKEREQTDFALFVTARVSPP